MSSKKLRKINIGQLGTLSIDIPVLSIGAGPKRVVFLCGIHGDERSGLFVVNKLLPSLKSLNGVVDIVIAANPLAQALNQRVSPNDLADVNRMFPGNLEADFTQIMAHKILEFCKGADAVIDLHTFEDTAPIVAIFMNSGSADVRSKSLKLIEVFNPQAVWQLDFTSLEESKLLGALGPILANEGIPNFAVEMPQSFSISEQEIGMVKNGLLRVLHSLGVINEKPAEVKHGFSIFKRKNTRVKTAGLFIPHKTVFTEVKAGDVIGELVSLPMFKGEPVCAPCEGTLLIIKQRNLVSTGDVVFSIGVKV